MSRAAELPGRLGAMARAAGSIKKLAADLDVSRMSLWYWAHGRTPELFRQRVANAWASARGLKPPFHVKQRKLEELKPADVL